MKKRKRSKTVKPSRRGTKEDREIYARNFERGIPAFVSSAHYDDRDARIMRIKMKRRLTNPIKRLSAIELKSLTPKQRAEYHRQLDREGWEEISKVTRSGPNYSHPTKQRRRKTNPKIQNMFVLIAQKAGGPVLKYIGGVRFASKGRAVLFPSRKDAQTTGREMLLHFPILKGYKLSVKS